jgi:glycosyltransferase involved in cell wall biosynthesis
MRVAIVIPAFNEAATIRDIAERSLAQCSRVIVVDDGSTDGTAAALRTLPVTLLRHSHNQGKAASLWTGFQHALAEQAELIVTLDGDGQHRPEDVPRLIAVAQRHPHRLIIGARLRGRAAAPRARRIANAVADFWLSWAAGHAIADSQSGQRAYPATLLQELNLRHDYAAAFTLESEILIVAARRGYETVATPIDTIYCQAGRASHFRPSRDIGRITRMVARHLLATGMNVKGLRRSLATPSLIVNAEEYNLSTETRSSTGTSLASPPFL